MTPACNRERLRKVRRHEIRDHENHSTTRDDTIHVIQRSGEVGSPPLGFEIEHFANQTQRVQTAFLRRDEQLDLVGEKQQPDLVVIVDGAKRKNRGHLGG